MKQLLSAYAHNVYSQFGEDGMIAKLIELLDININHHRGFCVEFGAGDGTSCSNTRLLREQGWDALLVESNMKLVDEMLHKRNQTHIHPMHTDVRRCEVKPVGEHSIDALLASCPYYQNNAIDLMSIDVDGDDWHIFRHLQCRPKIVIIEFNCSVPPHLALVGKEGRGFGASALAMKRLAAEKDYLLAGITLTNAIFVDAVFAPGSLHGLFEDDLAILMSDRQFACVVSDYKGNGYLTPGQEHTYWGWKGFKNSSNEFFCYPRAV